MTGFRTETGRVVPVSGPPTQGRLLDVTNGAKARRAIEEVGKMLDALCPAFSLPGPAEFSNPFGGVGSR
jgi:hypothetical protein